uniref:C-type lectin domain-containing protein n=1 Tax=Macrostomum lignano TaxID=282301 RepID=A0A1I8IN14_9PLAT
GAGGNANVLKEICEPLGADIYADKFQLGDPTLSPLELWGAEYQESDACLVPPDLMERLRRIGARERCPAIDVGVVRDTGVVTLYSFGRGDSVVSDGGDGAKRARVRDPEATPVCLPLDAVLSGVPQKEFLLDCSNLKPYRLTDEQPPSPLECSQSYLLASLLSVLSCPDVGSKRFLTNKVDRSVTGLVAQQQCVGPLHTPLADVAVVALSYFDRVGGATAIGEQPIKGLLDPSRAGRMAVCEALTNLAMARVTSLADVKCSTNWMWPGKRGADGGQLVATALATVDFMKQLGVAIDGGKDSLSMAASVTNQTTGETQVIRSPGQLVVSVYAVCPDITLTLQPVLQPHAGPLIHVPLGDLPDACRLGGSAFARCSSGGGDIFGRDCPNPDALRLAAGFAAVQSLLSETSPKLLTAGHDISDGGLAVAAIEMALAAGGRCGLELRVPDSVACPTAWLMSEEPGWLLQAASNEAANQVLDRLNSAGLSTGVRIVGLATVAGELRIVAGDRVLLDKVSLADLREAWERPSHQLELAQCQPDCARSELRYLREAGGANQYVATATEPCLLPSVDRLLAMERRFTVAIIREEGSNGDREMAAAFYAAGFRVLDVTTGDLAADGDGEDGVSLADCRGVAFVGGFSYADVLGSAKGWAAQVQFHPSVHRELDALRRRGNSFSLGVCNGCQLMARIGWLDGDSDSGSSDSSAPVTLEPNLSGRFESRYPTVRVLPTSCPLLRGMSDSRLGVWSAHGEGRFSVASADSLLAAGRVPLVYVDQAGEATESYPCNPNGSPKGLAAVCSPCGRHLAMMPHPERSFLTWQCPAGQQASTNSSDDNNLASPWFKMFKPFAVIIALVILPASLAACPSPYTLVNGFCLFWNLSDTKRSWWDSAKFCQSINGELALGIERARAVRPLIGGSQLWIGANDFLVERYRNRTGWLWANGTQLPELGDSDWESGMPDDQSQNDDCMAVRGNGLRDACTKCKKACLCQPVQTPNSSTFEPADFLQLGDITPFYCSTDIEVEKDVKAGLFRCLDACASRWECRAALVNTKLGRCRMLDYSDASVGDGIEKNPDWRKFVK